MRTALWIIVLVVAVCSVTGVAKAVGGRAVAVFASEKLEGQMVASSFSSYSGETVRFNECETAVGAVFRERGFSVPETPLVAPMKDEARKLHTVFDRYTDVSAMPNDIVVKAAGIVDKSAQLATACAAFAGNGGDDDDSAVNNICASASCKVIDTRTKRRVAAFAGKKCVALVSDKTVGLTQAISEACREVGNSLLVKLGDRY